MTSVIDKLDELEQEFLRASRHAINGIVVSLTMQVDSDSPILPTKQLRDMARNMSLMLQHTASFGRTQAQDEVAEAKSKRFAVGPVKTFPVKANAAAAFYPHAGVDWYDSYALRLVGITQTATLERAKDIISQGVTDGLTRREVVKALGDVLSAFAKHRLENIARTETSKIYQQARWQEFDSTDEIVGYEVVAILDRRTSPICKTRDGKQIRKADIDGWLPPYHYQCRTTLAPIFEWEAEPNFINAASGIKPIAGFGLTSMEIPQPKTLAEKQTVKQLVGLKIPDKAFMSASLLESSDNNKITQLNNT